MTRFKSNFLSATPFVLLFILAAVLAFGSNRFSVVTEGIALWAASVLPALFPYFFITAVLSKLSFTRKIGNGLGKITKPLFNTGGMCGYAFLMSVISGYPIGASLVSDLRRNNLIGEAEAVRSACLCSTSSPMFLIASVGTIMFGNKEFGILLFAVHFISALINGFIFSFYKRKNPPVEKLALDPSKPDNILYDGVYSAVVSVLVVGGLITLFYLLTDILLSFGILNPLIFVFTFITGSESAGEGIALGLFECTQGLKAISTGGISFLTLPCVAGICGLGGLSVIAQSLAYLKRAKIKTAPFVLSKLSGAIINFIIGIIFSACVY